RPAFVGYEFMRELDTTTQIMGETGNPELQKAISADLETVRKGKADTLEYTAAIDRLTRVLETRRHLTDFASTPVDFMNQETLSKYSKEVGKIYSLEENPSHVETGPASSKKGGEVDEWADFADPGAKPAAGKDKATLPPPPGFNPASADKEASGPLTMIPRCYDPKALSAAGEPKFIAQTQKGNVSEGTWDIYRVRVQTEGQPKEITARLDPAVSENSGGAEKNLFHTMSFVNLDKVYDTPDGGKLRFTGNILGQGSASTIFEAKIMTPEGERIVAIKIRTHAQPGKMLAEDPGFKRADWEASVKAQIADEGKAAQILAQFDPAYQNTGMMTVEGGHAGVILPRFDVENSKSFYQL